MRKNILIFIILIIVLSCGKNDMETANKKQKESEKQTSQLQNQSKTPEEEVREMVEIWNEASSNGDFIVLENMLADKVEYYQSTVTKDYYIEDQKKFFQKNPVYGQVIKGDIDIKKISNNQYKAEFVKEVTTKKGTKDYPSYLVFKKTGNDWKLVLESDKVSDQNIENKNSKKSENKVSSSNTVATQSSQNNLKSMTKSERAAYEKGIKNLYISGGYCSNGTIERKVNYQTIYTFPVCQISGLKYRNITVVIDGYYSHSNFNLSAGTNATIDYDRRIIYLSEWNLN